MDKSYVVPRADFNADLWRIADIAYGLGFDYTIYFNNFFKKDDRNSSQSITRASCLKFLRFGLIIFTRT